MADKKHGRSRQGSSRSSPSRGKRSRGNSSSSGANGKGRSSSGEGRSTTRSSKNDRAPRDVVLDAARQLQDLIGRPIESVLGMERDGNEWSVAVEVLELERVPNTTDLLGRYEITVDRDGELIAVRRTRRYLRAEAGEV